jgi:ectoine hydroxylase-related dioxygenase (phytanoyl-CoA dioxygenase family)
MACAMSEPTARLLLDEVLDQLAFAQEHVTGFEDGEEHSHFSAVLAPAASEAAIATGDETRWDLRLALTEPVRAALHELLRGPVGVALAGLAGGNAALVELAAVVSAPGSAPQVLHPDAEWSASGLVFTAFVALQDVSASMGPTLFLRETHTQEAHVAHAAGVAGPEGINRAFLAAADARAALLRCGEAVVYDRRLLHAGGRNTSADGEARVLFYVTFARVDVEGADLWNANSLRSEYRQAMWLEQLRGSERVDAAVGERSERSLPPR